MYSHFSVVVLHFYVHFYLIFIVLISLHYTCTLFSYDMFTHFYVYLYFVILVLVSRLLSLIMCHAPPIFSMGNPFFGRKLLCVSPCGFLFDFMMRLFSIWFLRRSLFPKFTDFPSIYFDAFFPYSIYV
jgi:hypothetical protein